MGKKQGGRGRDQVPTSPPLELTNEKIAELKSQDTLIIDGSIGEGGGQILRISFALASILKKYTANFLLFCPSHALILCHILPLEK